jgi:LysM repeat protein
MKLFKPERLSQYRKTDHSKRRTGKMTPSENGNDKDFVLSGSQQGSELSEPREEIYYGTAHKPAGGHAFRYIYIAIAGFCVLIVLSIVIIARTYSLAEKTQLLAMQSRLEQLESRLGSLEGEGGLASAGGPGNQLILLTERLDQLEANMTARIANLANQIQSAPPQTAPAAVQENKTSPAAVADQKQTPAKIHTVQKGETLYRISRQYNLSVEQLRQYNKLDANASIYPGQKLNVSPPQ